MSFTEISTSTASTTSGVFVDVRETHELVAGFIPGAVLLPMSEFNSGERLGLPEVHDERPVVVYCAHGARSQAVAAVLAEEGYREVYSMSGGFEGWRAEGGPVTAPTAGLRYERQMQVDIVGHSGQERLRQASVGIVGIGGLGNAAAAVLAAAGVGELVLIDDDLVEESNLARQPLFNTYDIGTPKVNAAAERLGVQNPDVQLRRVPRRWQDVENLNALIGKLTLIVDATDDVPTHLAIAEAATRSAVPVVHGACYRTEGTVFVADSRTSACYRCLVRSLPTSGANCNTEGVLGSVVATVGSMQATAAQQVILGRGDQLFGSVTHFDALVPELTTLPVAIDPDCPNHDG